MAAQLAEAEALGVQALWWTEHDWRMAAHSYLPRLSFAELKTNDYQWELDTDNSIPDVGDHEVVMNGPMVDGQSTPVLRLGAIGDGSRRGEHRLSALSDRGLYNTSLNGQEWSVTVHLDQVEERAFLALDVLTSWRPALDGRQAGPYRLSYRFSDHREGVQVVDHVAEIYVKAPLGRWHEVLLRPAEDLSAAWPGIDGRDASCTELSVAAMAWGRGSVAGHLHEITIARAQTEGQQPLATQRALMDHYAPSFPAVTQLQALELSAEAPHVCAYGGTVQIPPEGAGPPISMASQIQASGGVAAYAHPFGVGGGDVVQGEQPELRRSVFESLKRSSAHGCIALEVGYRQRGGADLSSHESVWDACSRHGIFLTGLGVNDNHSGMNWATQTNNFMTWLWSSSTSEEDLLSAMRSGHAYFGDPALFTGQLDLRIGSSAHMGMAVARQAPVTDVQLLAIGLPENSELEVIHLQMNTAPAPSNPDEAVVMRFHVDELLQGSTEISLTTTADCLVRTRVRAESGEVIALSNPLWVLTEPGAVTVPVERRSLANNAPNSSARTASP